MSNPIPKENYLPPPIQDLTAVEVFLFTRISLHLIQGFIEGKFKPARHDRENLSTFANKFYRWNEVEKQAFVERKKYREVRKFLSLAEKDELFSQQSKNEYNRKLDKFVDKYFDQIIQAAAEK